MSNIFFPGSCCGGNSGAADKSATKPAPTRRTVSSDAIAMWDIGKMGFHNFNSFKIDGDAGTAFDVTPGADHMLGNYTWKTFKLSAAGIYLCQFSAFGRFVVQGGSVAEGEQFLLWLMERNATGFTGVDRLPIDVAAGGNYAGFEASAVKLLTLKADTEYTLAVYTTTNHGTAQVFWDQAPGVSKWSTGVDANGADVDSNMLTSQGCALDLISLS